jgi:hypothetical protein
VLGFSEQSSPNSLPPHRLLNDQALDLCVAIGHYELALDDVHPSYDGAIGRLGDEHRAVSASGDNVQAAPHLCLRRWIAKLDGKRGDFRRVASAGLSDSNPLFLGLHDA